MSHTERKPDMTLLSLLLAVVVIGLIILASASTVIAYQEHGQSSFYLRRQLLNIGLGLVLFLAALKFDYRKLQRHAGAALILAIGLLVLVFIPGIGRELQGARRWIDIGPIFFQPAELVKLLFLIYLAAWLTDRGRALKDRAMGLWPFLLAVGVIAGLVAVQPDVGTMSIIGVMALAMYFVAGAPLRDMSLIFVLTAAAFAVLVKSAPYRADRFLVFLNPQHDPLGIGYQINQSLLAIGSGGLFGLGLGHSRQKFNYLPEVSTDSIFAVAAEELGFIIAVGFLMLFTAFIIRGFRVAQGVSDNFGKLLAVGITSWIGFQAILNIGALTGLLPLTGVPLPFVSYGGTSILVSFIGMGILGNISRHAKTV